MAGLAVPVEGCDKEMGGHERGRLRMQYWASGLATSASLLWLLLAPAAQAKVVLTHYNYGGHGDDHRRFVEERAQAFMKANPDIEIQIVTDAGSNYWDKLTSMTAAGAGPDVIELYPEAAAPFVVGGAVRDLRPFLQRDRDINLQDFVPVTVDGFTWNGVIWGLPTSTYQILAFYNLDLLDAQGLVAPADLGTGWTWQTLRDYGRKLTRDQNGDGKPEQWGIRAAHDFFRWWILADQAGGKLFDRIVDPTRATFLDPGVQVGLQYYTDLVLVDRSVQLDVNPWYQGAVGISIVDGPSMFGILANRGVAWRWDVAQLAKGPEHNGTFVFLNGFQMGAQTKHPEEAWRWLKFLVSEESLREYARITGRTPARLRLLPQYLRLLPSSPPHVQAAVDAVLNPRSRIAYLMAGSTQIRQVVNRMVSNEVMTGKRSVREALTELDRQVNAILSEARKQTGAAR